MTKAPAFQFYAADFLSDEAVIAMTLEQRGAYITLLALAWREHGIPSNETLLTSLLGISRRKFNSIWPSIRGKFVTTPEGRLVNLRLEREREKQALYRENKRRAGKASGVKRRTKSVEQTPVPVRTANEQRTNRNEPFSLQSSSSEETKEEERSNANLSSLPLQAKKKGSVPSRAREERATGLLRCFNVAAGTRFSSREFVRSIARRLEEHPDLSDAAHEAIMRRNLARPWWEGKPSPSVIYGSAAQFERAMHEQGDSKHPADVRVAELGQLAEKFRQEEAHEAI